VNKAALENVSEQKPRTTRALEQAKKERSVSHKHATKHTNGGK
jgi:ribonuclease R